MSHTFEAFASREINPDTISQLIMHETGWNCSHSGIIVDNTTIYHATRIGFHEFPLNTFLQEHQMPHIIKIPVINDEVALRFLQRLVNTPYDKSSYVAFKATVLQKHTANGLAEMVCSEATMQFCAVNTRAFDPQGVYDFYDPKQTTDALYEAEKRLWMPT